MKVCIQLVREENGWYTAVCPSLPGCLSHGVSCEEAVQKIDEAIRGYLAAVSDAVTDKVEHEVVEVPPPAVGE